MRTINYYFIKIKMNFYFNMAKMGLNKAHKHMGDSMFWRYVKVFSKYYRKYCDLQSKVEL